MIQCERGHFFDENRYSGCPYCNQINNQQRSVIPPIAPAMEIPKPSCGKTVAIEGMDTTPSVGKTVAIDNFEENTPHIGKTVAITEDAAYAPPAAPSSVEQVSSPSVAAAPAVPVAAAAVATPFSEPTPFAAPTSSENTAVSNGSLINDGAQEQPGPASEQTDPESIMRPYQVTGLGVKENPQPIPVSEPTYERPYAVSGLGVKENPTPTSAVEVGATFPVPQQGEAPMSAEASAFASVGFPGGPNPFMAPGMIPGMPVGAPPAPVPTTPSVEVPAPIIEPVSLNAENSASVVEEPSPEVSEAASVIEETAPVVEESAPIVEEIVHSEPETVPAVAETVPVEQPVVAPQAAPIETSVASPFIMPAPVDPHATVAMTESDMDYLPRVHARAFLVCTDGPMTGASFVFQENKAIIGRQKNYEISLFRDPSVSRSPHAIIKYDKDSLTYTVAPGDAEKRVSVNGTFITSEQSLGIYDILGIGQSRLLFIPVCSEKFAW